MKKKPLLLILLLSIVFTFSCKKKGCTDDLSYTYNSDAKKDDGSCKYYYNGKNNGQLDVASKVNNYSNEEIYIDGEYIGMLMYYFPNGVGCADPNTIGRVMASGSHIVKSVGINEVREGTVNLSQQECKVIYLENLPLIGSGGGGGGGGSGSGNLTFWLNQDLGCGNLYVTINSYGTKSITQYYTGGNPGCGASGCANFTNLPYGAYSYSVSSDGTCTWSGNISISQSCHTIQLTL